jgi:hypothetical protein
LVNVSNPLDADRVRQGPNGRGEVVVYRVILVGKSAGY